MIKSLVTLVTVHTHTHTHGYSFNNVINRFENNSCEIFFARTICVAQNLIRDG